MITGWDANSTKDHKHKRSPYRVINKKARLGSNVKRKSIELYVKCLSPNTKQRYRIMFTSWKSFLD